MNEPILDCLTGDDIALALKEFVLRRRGIDPGTVRTSAQVSYPLNVPPPTAAAVRVEPVPPEPRKAASA